MTNLGRTSTFHRCCSTALAVALDVRLLVLAGLAIVCGSVARQVDSGCKSGATDRPFAQISEHNLHAQILPVTFSPDGSFVAAATISGNVWLRDLATDESCLLQSGPMLSAQCVSFSPDGRVLAVAASNPAVRLWDVKTREELAPLQFQGGARRIAFSRDGTMLALGQSWKAGRNDVIIVRSWRGNRRVSFLEGPGGGVSALAFSVEGATLAAGYSSGLFRLWDMATGKARATLEAHGKSSGGIAALAWSPDGTLLATAGVMESTVRLWDAKSGKPRGTLPAKTDSVNALAFSRDGSILAMAQSGGIAALWDVSQARELATVRAPSRSLWAVAFSADGRVLATGGMDGILRLWDIAHALGGKPSSDVGEARAGSVFPPPNECAKERASCGKWIGAGEVDLSPRPS
jgi:WD40 repeat protein